MDKAKPFSISKHLVFESWQRVKANGGSAGIDKESMASFEKNLSDNLYKIWNRMSSGSYFPPAVLEVLIPKRDGSQRPLGVPTVSDRIAQMVLKLSIEPRLEKLFHEDSYGYRPNKSALQAIGKARQRCWRYDWVIDLDIKGFFDSINHELLLRAVRRHVKEDWQLLYIERWLQAPVQKSEGRMEKRERGTPQGGVVSPLLANLFLHYVFDKWMEKMHPETVFERYADDIIVHCVSQEEAERLLETISRRFEGCMLSLHPEKTKVVYCRDDRRSKHYANESFDFLGYTFKSRKVRLKTGRMFMGFNPAISAASARRIKDTILSWNLHRWCFCTTHEVARRINAKLRGWINYYGRYYRSALAKVLEALNFRLVKWAKKKYKKLRSLRQSGKWLRRIYLSSPNLFAHWEITGVWKVGH